MAWTVTTPSIAFMRYDTLITYLHDHLAGARGALDLLRYLAEHAADQELRGHAARLADQVEEERTQLEAIAVELGGEATAGLKEASAWMGEKLSHLKLGRLTGRVHGLPLFEAVETLMLGVRGKMALWDALALIASEDPVFPRRDFAILHQQAASQLDQLERHRLRLAKAVLIPAA
jgi:hypothetical protein